MRIEKRLILKRKWVVLLTIIAVLSTQFIVKSFVNTYKERLHECDAKNGYVCNVFGR